jgi:hypothetical protein
MNNEKPEEYHEGYNDGFNDGVNAAKEWFEKNMGVVLEKFDAGEV